jgi:RNA polymerase sigma-70 factor (ECF subfamily)
MGAPNPAVDPATSDEDLLARHVAGDAGAFAEIFRRHRDRLWAVALRTLGDREDAADAVQDAFVSAYRNAASFRGESQVTTWLHRIVVNACIDVVRRRQARPTVPLPADENVQAAGDDISAREQAADVATALASLPVEQAAAIVLVDALGYPVEEAARILAAPTGTVKSRCARGRARLAVALGHWAPERNQDPPGAVPLIASSISPSRPEEVQP